MKAVREIFFFREYFDLFFDTLDEKVKEKVDEVLFMITILDKIPKKFFNKIEGVKGLYEIRIEYNSNIYRIFCCFDKGNLVVLFNGFQKKSQKTPKHELERAENLMKEYFSIKNI